MEMRSCYYTPSLWSLYMDEVVIFLKLPSIKIFFTETKLCNLNLREENVIILKVDKSFDDDFGFRTGCRNPK
jgi:hypothetical protein